VSFYVGHFPLNHPVSCNVCRLPLDIFPISLPAVTSSEHATVSQHTPDDFCFLTLLNSLQLCILQQAL